MPRESTLKLLQSVDPRALRPRALVGFDGFIDTIVRPVGLRHGPGENFSAIATITDFAARVQGAAGKSTNLEFYPLQDKVGGNGPIMAQALASAGTPVTYIGALGQPTVHPVFAELGKSARLYSVAAPAQTTAVEFQDGKLMLGQMRSLDDVTFARLTEAMTPELLRAEFAAASLVALVNWTMLPHMTAIFSALTDDVFPQLPAAPRVFFFDLADPEKRSQADLRAGLSALAAFQNFGNVTLGLNLKEAQQVCAALQLPAPENHEASLCRSASALREALGIFLVAIHPRESAACATRTESFWAPGPYTDSPLLTTGAGDHFNAGFSLGLLLNFPPANCLDLALASSGAYVRTGVSPTWDELANFIALWL